jgi:hypothetical protein
MMPHPRIQPPLNIVVCKDIRKFPSCRPEKHSDILSKNAIPLNAMQVQTGEEV